VEIWWWILTIGILTGTITREGGRDGPGYRTGVLKSLGSIICEGTVKTKPICSRLFTRWGHERIVIVVRRGEQKEQSPRGTRRYQMSKNTITRAAAIAIAIERTQDLPEVNEVLKNMHAQLVKPRAKAVSKARLANENLARKLAEMLPAEGIGSKAIVGLGLPEVATTQKAAAVMRVAEELGLVQKVVDKKVITYKPIAKTE